MIAMLFGPDLQEVTEKEIKEEEEKMQQRYNVSSSKHLIKEIC